MKKVTLLIAMAALVIFAGCNKDKETQGTTLKASITQNQGDSKTSLYPISDTEAEIRWTTGDKILVSNGGTPVQFTLKDGNGSTNGTFTYGGEFEVGYDTKAVYPSTVNFDGTNISITLPAEQTLADLNQIGTFANGANPMFGEYNGEGITFTSLCGVLGLSLKAENEDEVIPLTAIEIVSNNPNDKLNGTYTCTTDDTELSYTGTNGTNSIKLNCPSGTALTGTPKEFYIVLPAGTLASTVADEAGFTLNLYNGGAEPFFTKPRTSALPMEANCVKKMNTLDVTEDDGHPCVDLGLPSGTLWAIYNVGAESPEEYGDWFAWGETEPKGNGDYEMSTYKYAYLEDSYYHLSKYNTNPYYGFVDNLTVLEAGDDAATVNWGGRWRTPTNDEFEELINNTTVIFTTQNNVSGCLFTATNGHSIFLPATGCGWGPYPYGVGESCYYWSSSLGVLGMGDDSQALAFECYDGSPFAGSIWDRSYGLSIRPVRATAKK